MITTLDVIWIYDGTIDPPARKMVVCICPHNGFYFRINSRPWPEAVVIGLPEHPFLSHDSHIECNGPLDLDDYSVEESIKIDGIIGKIDSKAIPDIVAAVRKCRSISEADKAIIFESLERRTRIF